MGATDQPIPSGPQLPGHGIRPADEGTGPLRWRRAQARFANASYGIDHGIEVMDLATNATIQVRPRWAIQVRPRWAAGLDADDFSGSPTRWAFG